MLIKSHIFWYLGRSKLKLIWNCKPISLGLSVSTSLVTGHQCKRPNNFPGWEDPSVLYGNNPTTTTILIFMQKRTFGIITIDFDNVRGFILHVQNSYMNMQFSYVDFTGKSFAVVILIYYRFTKEKDLQY